MKKKSRILFIVLLIVIIGSAAALRVVDKNHKEGIREIKIESVDLNALKDGVYIGSYSVFPVMAEVKVTITDKEITSVELTQHQHGRGSSAEIVIDRIIDSQSLVVDTVAGATASSKVIVKAIEQALLNE